MYCVAQTRHQHADEYDKHVFYVSIDFHNLNSPSGAAGSRGSEYY